jgi:uncharacterized protein YcbX
VQVGVVRELWRYPVKSMRGERVGEAVVHAGIGIAGDRGWAVRDEEAGEIRSAKRVPALLQCIARYVTEPVGAATPAVAITLPDGSEVRSDDPDVHDVLSAVLGRRVTLWPRVAADRPEHFLRRDVLDAEEMRRQYGLAAGEPFPVPSSSAPPRRSDLRRYVSPLGTYFDADELHLLSTAAIDELRRRHPDAGVDVRRYRPNLVVGTDAAPLAELPELAWVGKRLRIGGTVIEVPRRTQRCVMITHPQAELGGDRSVLRTLVREMGHTLGVAGDVATPGIVRAGDPVELV